MARKVQTESHLRQPCAGPHHSIPPALLCILFLLAGVSISMAGSLASENRKGNRLFAQGKYQDAEQAYLNAEVEHPGRPEILYNLGNSQIKQKKFEKAIQTLRQSAGKGEKEIKEDSWYNAGDAYFLMGDYKSSADAFIQALKLNPADKDAKHNLELALMKLKQQQSKQNQESRNSESSRQQQRQTDKQQNQNQTENRSRDESGRQKGNAQNDSAGRQSPPGARREASMTKEQALQVLDALKNQELQDRRMLLEHRAGQQSKTRDW